MLGSMSQVAAVRRFWVGIVSLNAGIGGLNCAPTVWGKFWGIDQAKDFVPYPIFSLKFGDAGFSALFILTLYYEVDWKRNSTLELVFKDFKTVELCMESADMMSQDFSCNPWAWKYGCIVALAIAKQHDMLSKTWPVDLVTRFVHWRDIMSILSSLLW